MGGHQTKVRNDKLLRHQKATESQSNCSIAEATVILNVERLEEMIDIETGLLHDLFSHHVIDQQQVQLIEAEQTANSKIKRLIKIISEQSVEQQVEFLSVLHKYHQSHVVNYIRNKGQQPKDDNGDWPLAASGIWSKIEKHWHKLVDLIDSRDLLLSELLSKDCVTIRQEQNISRLSVPHNRNEMLLNILRRRSIRNYNEFINALLRTNQPHVVSLLEPDFLGSDTYQPLNDRQTSALNSNLNALTALIDTQKTGLLNALLSVGCITQPEYENLATKTSSEAVKSLLDSIKRGSNIHLAKFLGCLNRTGQQHVTRIILDGDSTSFDVVAKTSLDEVEEEKIVERFKTLLRESDTFRSRVVPQIDRLYKDLKDGSALIAMKTGQSIKLFLLCKSLLGLWNLHMMYFDGQLKTLLQELFAALLGNQKTVVVDELRCDMKDYVVQAERLSELMVLPKFTRIYQLALQTYDVLPDLNMVHPLGEFPFEMTEIIIFRAAAHFFVIGSKLTTRACVYLFVMLSAVNRSWWETLKYRKRMKVSFKRYCERFFQPYKFDAELVSSTPTMYAVEAIAEFNGKLFVKWIRSSAIQVFGAISQNDEVVDEIKLPRVMDANIVICNETSYLFVIEPYQQTASKNVWRIGLLPGGATEEFIATTYMVGNTSVRCGRLLITPKPGDPVNPICLYTEDGQLNKRIRLPKDMEALNSIETSKETFVVLCYVRRPRFPPQMSIMELSDEGIVLCEFSNTRLSHHSFITVDANNFILFSDGQDKQIFLLNPDLELKCILITLQLNENVYKLFYSQQTGNLYVGRSGHIDVYKVASFH